MKSWVLVSIVAIAAAVAMLDVLTQRVPSEGQVDSYGEIFPVVVYSRAELLEHPRGPLPEGHPEFWFRKEDYPSAAMLSNPKNMVRYRVAVDVYGEVSNCTTIESSGVPALDRRVCSVVEARATFHPALDSRQAPVAGSYEGVVAWEPEENEGRFLMMDAEVGAGRQLLSCSWSGDAHPLADPMQLCAPLFASVRDNLSPRFKGPYRFGTSLEEARRLIEMDSRAR